MEDVLEVYQRPHDPQRPLVCRDETSKQLIVETRAPIPAKGDARHVTITNTKRNGLANLFMVFAPLEGWRHVKVSDRHAAIDYAHTLRDWSDVHCPGAGQVSRPAGFHRQPLAEPSVTLARHSAPIRQTRLAC